MKLLLLNSGSSSLKATLVDSTNGFPLASAIADWAGSSTQYRFQSESGSITAETDDWRGCTQATRQVVRDLIPNVLSSPQDLSAVGHRVVHGGEFTSSVHITPQVRSRIAALAELAPLHNPPSLETLAAAELALPDVPHIAVFDTAFHATLPPHAVTYPLPEQWTKDWGLRRYGFHGLSYQYCSRRAAEMLNRPLQDLRLVICHLGHGCSAAAVQGGRCVDTTMGFTPLEGLMMGTRSGSVDPGLLLYVMRRYGVSPAEMETALNRKSGLLGVSGISADMRTVMDSAGNGHASSQLALDIYAHRVRQAIGALTVTMGGIDALVFTAGVGEHASEIRKSICDGLGCLGVSLDPEKNSQCTPDANVSAMDAQCHTLVIATREDLTMLLEVQQVLSTT